MASAIARPPLIFFFVMLSLHTQQHHALQDPALGQQEHEQDGDVHRTEAAIVS